MGYKFVGYFKYMFTFENEDGEQIYIGGDADDIYNMDVRADKEYTKEELEEL